LLTEVRRALKAASDYFYPPVPGKVRCADGVERSLGDEQYLNRLQEFLAQKFAHSTAKELMAAELNHLNAFLRRLNDMASKGVHAPVSLAESKQGLVGLYFFYPISAATCPKTANRHRCKRLPPADKGEQHRGCHFPAFRATPARGIRNSASSLNFREGAGIHGNILKECCPLALLAPIIPEGGRQSI
jgi:hypothetical protein